MTRAEFEAEYGPEPRRFTSPNGNIFEIRMSKNRLGFIAILFLVIENIPDKIIRIGVAPTPEKALTKLLAKIENHEENLKAEDVQVITPKLPRARLEQLKLF